MVVPGARYPHAALTATEGAVLESGLRDNAPRLAGLLPGADIERWNPATDLLLPNIYDATGLRGKTVCRDLLLGAVGLAPGPAGPVCGLVTRTGPEQGFDVGRPVRARRALAHGRWVIRGRGEPAAGTCRA